MSDLKRPLNPEPNNIFLALEDTSLTFADVNRRVSRTGAAILRHRLLEPGDRVAILMAKPAPFILTLLALMRLRAVSVPLNTRLAASELAWQIQNVDCRLLICEAETRALAGETGANVMELPNIDREDPAPQYGDFGMMNLDDDFAIVHTSGTSGKPKAATLTCGNIYHSARASAERLGHTPKDRWLCVMPLYHLGGLSIILRSLIYGSTVHLLSATSFDVDHVNLTLSALPITLVSLVPTMLQRLLDAKTRPWNPHLRLILLGGEAPSAELLARCAADNLPIAATYGLTETASQAATALPDLVYRKPGTVGKPLKFAQVRIINERGEDAPPNTPGEILVSGASVMRGYYKDPAASAKALRNGWLHTGDIGCLDEDGDLFVLQRREDLIVSGGENIYPAEVEAVLRQHPAVAEAVVLGLADAAWGQRVAALIETRTSQSATSDDIIAFARQRLAGYKIPRQIAFATALPRTSSGKVQRREARKAFTDAL